MKDDETINQADREPAYSASEQCQLCGYRRGGAHCRDSHQYADFFEARIIDEAMDKEAMDKARHPVTLADYGIKVRYDEHPPAGWRSEDQLRFAPLTNPFPSADQLRPKALERFCLRFAWTLAIVSGLLVAIAVGVQVYRRLKGNG